MGRFHAKIVSGIWSKTAVCTARETEEPTHLGSTYAFVVPHVGLAEKVNSRVVDQLNEAVEIRNQVLSKLLPSIDFSNLPSLPRDEILRLINNSGEGVPHTTQINSHQERDCSPDEITDPDDGDHEWAESAWSQDYASPIADDVNGLALSRRSGSYVGISSTSTALRSMFFHCPLAKQTFLQMSASFSKIPSRHKSSSISVHEQTGLDQSPLYSASAVSEQAAIDAYFNYLHLALPMIDELWFRNEFASHSRTDDAWIALSNMVLAFGSITAGDDRSHTIYYNRVQQVVGHNVFSSGNIEMLQALILLGGAYMHYINSPNTAYLMMGTALRMAFAMALHRDPARGSSAQSPCAPSAGASPPPGRYLSKIESRRRTWWCLVCCDSWSGMILGRPSIARWDPLTMDTKLPSEDPISVDGQVQRHLPRNEADRDWSGTILRLNSEFCKITSKIECRLAQFSRLTPREVMAFEAQLQAWERSRPEVFKFGTSCAQNIRYIRNNMYHRVQAARICMTRPFLLRLAEDVSSYPSFTKDELQMLSLCRNTASQLIDTICSNVFHNRINVWQASWYLFQACLIPLLFLCVDSKLPPDSHLEEDGTTRWRDEIERGIRTFEEMAPWTRSTDKYGMVIEALYKGVVLGSDQKRLGIPAPNDISTNFGFSPMDSESPLNFDQQILGMFDVFPDWLDYDVLFGSGSAYQ